MDEMTTGEILKAVDDLSDDEREYLKLLLHRVMLCFVNAEHHAVLLFGKENTEGYSICTINCDEIPAANMVSAASGLMSFVATEDAPPKEKFN